MGLDEKLVEILDKTMNGLEKGADFMVAELPDVIYQLLLWYGIYSGIQTILGLVVAYVAYRVVVSTVKAVAKEEKGSWAYDDYSASVPAILVLILAPFVGIAGLFTANLTWLQIWIAPKIWLIEYTANLVK